jgi:hypothetical protein
MTTRSHTALVFLPALMLCAARQGALSQEITLPPEVQDALVWNARHLSPITMSWTQKSQPASWSPEETTAKLRLAGDPAAFFYKQSRQVIWQDGKMYCCKNYEENGDLYRYERSFDGKLLYNGSPDERLPSGVLQPTLLRRLVSRLAETQPELECLDTDYYDGIGLRLPKRAREMQSQTKGTAEIPWLLETGGHLNKVEDVELNGQAMMRVEVVAENWQRRRALNIDLAEREKLLRSGNNTETYIRQELAAIRRMQELPETRTHVFYLDPRRHYAVQLREERNEDGALVLRTDNSDFQLLGGRGVWLPRKSVTEYYTWPSVAGVFDLPVLRRVIEVSGWSLDPVPERQFVLDYTIPGSLISDEVWSEKPFSYHVPIGLENLEQLVGELGEPLPSGADAHLDSVAQAERKPIVEGARSNVPNSKTTTRVHLAIPSRKNHRGLLLILSNCAAAIAVGAFAFWRHRRGHVVQPRTERE